MATFIKVKLKDICEKISSGGTPSRKRPDYFDSDAGHLWVKSKELLEKGILDTEEKISEVGLQNSSAKYYPANTVLVAMYGVNAGQLAWLNRPATVNQAICALVVDVKKADWRFVYYSLLESRQELISQARGGAQPNLNKDMVENFETLMCADLKAQTRIASVLSTYDDLIENNEKRITALEEMAQLLYTEWFVKFKFPGHEKVKMVDSGTEYGIIPEGWNIVEMREIAKVVDCLHTKKPEDIKSGNKILLQLNNILDNGLIDLTEKYLISDTDYKKWTVNIELRNGDCVVTNVGRIAASAQIANGMVVAAGRNMTVLHPEKIPDSFLIQYLHSIHMVKEVSKKTDAGAIMGSLNVKNIYLLNVLLPEKSVLELYSKIASEFRDEMNKLHQHNYILSQARDLLIPQLVTGKRELK